MKRWILAGVVLCCSLTWGDDGFHSFTDITGRTITARIISYDANKQVIGVKLENGRQGKISLSQLSDEDKIYVEAWNQSKDFLNESRLKISIERYKDENNEIPSRSGAVKLSGENVGYVVHFDNRTDSSFEVVEVEYCIFYEQDMATSEGNHCAQGVRYSKQSMEKILPRSKKFCTTEPVVICKTELSDGYYYGSGANSSQRGDVHGIWVRASVELPGGEKIVREVCLPDTIPNKHKWTTESEHVGMNK